MNSAVQFDVCCYLASRFEYTRFRIAYSWPFYAKLQT